jgi:hypothetical protein
MRVVATPPYITEFYGRQWAPVRLLEDGEFAPGYYAHVVQMMFTCGVAISNSDWMPCRWCYKTRHEAVEALAAWDGKGHPPGHWIKFKGLGGELHGPGGEAEVML